MWLYMLWGLGLFNDLFSYEQFTGFIGCCVSLFNGE